MNGDIEMNRHIIFRGLCNYVEICLQNCAIALQNSVESSTKIIILQISVEFCGMVNIPQNCSVEHLKL